ncbi:MAG: hypothetical protein GC160_05390 [Acidobacteria bacterium]|nr:hypothetical protein [Acidobacteriota bacterium]
MRQWISWAILLVATTIPVQASSVLAVDFQQLSRFARHVISGEVTSVEAAKDSTGYIFSTVTIRVRRAVPTQLQGTDYTFRMLGGETSDGRLAIQGMPHFTVGDRVALFLNAKPEQVFGPTVGLWQGVFFVETDPTTGQDVMLSADRRPVTAVRENRLVTAPQILPKGGLGLKALAVEGQSGPSLLSADRFFEEVRLHRGQ